MFKSRLQILVPAGLATLSAASIAGGSELPAELVNCRALTSPEARLDCYDQFIDTQKAAPAEAVETATPTQASTAPRAAAAMPEAERAAIQLDLFGKNKGEIRDILAATGIEELDQIEATIARIDKNASGKIVITLDNGQVWLQTDSRRVRLSKEEKITIHRAGFGSYMLRTEEKVMRVKRIS